MGERLRLRRDYDLSGFSRDVRTILTALKEHGMFVADNGIDWAVSVAPDERIGNLHEELRRVKGEAFEVVRDPRRTSSAILIDQDIATVVSLSPVASNSDQSVPSAGHSSM